MLVEDSKEHRAALTFLPRVPKDLPGKPKPVIAYVEESDGLRVPYAYYLRTVGRAPSGLCDGDAIDVATAPGFRLDSKRAQDAAVAAIEENNMLAEDDGGGRGVLSLSCGAGKTVIAIYCIASVYRRKTLIVVHTNQLADQWADRIREFAPGVRLGRIQGPVRDVLDRDVVIATIQTLVKNRPSADDGFGLLVVDECHVVCTALFSRMLFTWPVKRILAVSATPKRKDGLDSVLFAHVGGFIFTGTREHVPARVERVYANCSARVERVNRYQKLDHVAMVTDLVKDAARTALVTQLVLKHHRSKVLVLSERRGHLDAIRDCIVLQRPDLEGQVGFYRGGLKRADLAESESRLIVLGTYSIASVGLDIRGLNTLILASPRSDVTQAVGRVLRDKSTLFPKTIVDVVDRFSVFISQASKRNAVYRKMGWLGKEPVEAPQQTPPTLQCLIQSE